MAREDPEDDWYDRAKCQGTDPNIFVPTGPGGNLDRAINICLGRDGLPACPVRAECAAAGEAGNEYGVWGGHVRSQRSVRVIEPITTVVDMRQRRA